MPNRLVRNLRLKRLGKPFFVGRWDVDLEGICFVAFHGEYQRKNFLPRSGWRCIPEVSGDDDSYLILAIFVDVFQRVVDGRDRKFCIDVETGQSRAAAIVDHYEHFHQESVPPFSACEAL